jgi:hypothetical protein
MPSGIYSFWPEAFSIIFPFLPVWSKPGPVGEDLKSPGTGKSFGSPHKSEQNFVFKVPQKMLNQMNLKAIDEMP